jgi:hypothetical protein
MVAFGSGMSLRLRAAGAQALPTMAWMGGAPPYDEARRFQNIIGDHRITNAASESTNLEHPVQTAMLYTAAKLARLRRRLNF